MPKEKKPPDQPLCPEHGVPLVFVQRITCHAGHMHVRRKPSVYTWCPKCKPGKSK